MIVLDFSGVLYNARPDGQALFDDVVTFLDGRDASEIILVSSGVPEVVGPVLEKTGIRNRVRECIFTAGRKKGEVLAEHGGFEGSDVVIVDDNPRELESVAAALPFATGVLMERFPDERGFTIHEFDTVANLLELEAFLDAQHDTDKESYE